MADQETARVDGGVAQGRGALMATVFLLQFLVAMDMSLVNIALPAMRADLGFTDASLQWVVTAYLLTFAGFMLLGGRIGDLWGRRTSVLVGLGVFAAASIVGGCAASAGVLVAARAVQGVAGALLAPASLALVAPSATRPFGHGRWVCGAVPVRPEVRWAWCSVVCSRSGGRGERSFSSTCRSSRSRYSRRCAEFHVVTSHALRDWMFPARSP